ncbi:MarR family winged helix-turn-helix transcriptional regulator [Novosphingobium sp. BL-52-GroH]|uniref:MarR family winged helix-turn-helix transcriptional regulator n=1 Tax=Novosphingobium sp. BL-52-GroH TaxID=3349877 RepID=UPI00384B50E0
MRTRADYHDAHSPQGARFVDLLDEVMRLNGRMLAAMRRSTRVTGLSPAESILLSTVVCSPSPPTVPRVGRALGQTRQGVQRTADRLVELGLIEWLPNPDHARAHCMGPTAEGRELYDRDNAESAQWADRTVAGMDPAALDLTLETLRELRRRLEEAERNAGP